MARVLAIILLLGGVTAYAQETALDRYVAKPDPAYGFEHYQTTESWGYTTYFVSMTSQRWRSTAEVDRDLWEHEVLIAVPWSARFNRERTAVLFIDGGGNGGSPPTEPEYLLGLAARVVGAPVVWLRQVPNQPLYFTDEVNRRRTEDEILAYSLDKFIVTGDEEWPVHVAMTKAGVRGMDTAQAVLADHGLVIDDFVVVGGSKRGWASWLTAAVDNRVRALVPASIDILNVGEQVNHHWEAYGFYTQAIRDYAEFDIFCRSNGPVGQALLDIVDPIAYRERLTMPKLILNSAGDQFFLPDSSRFYFDDLLEPKHLSYSFNTDHSQIRFSVLFRVVTWVRALLQDRPHSQYQWKILSNGAIVVQAQSTPSRVLLRYATNPDARDFRLESLGPEWRFWPLQPIFGDLYIGYMPPPSQGWSAFSIELQFDAGDFGLREVYTTDISILPNTLPFAGSHCVER
jgi:PhoPQ-activated pathogenicity-related protein